MRLLPGMIIASALLLATSALAAHLPSLAWMHGDSGNGPCCGDFDCTAATIVVLGQTATETTVQIGEDTITVPSHWVRPSEDAQGYWCFIPERLETPLIVKGLPYWVRTYADEDGQVRATPPMAATRENTRCVYVQALW